MAGRKPYQPTDSDRRLVEALVGCKITQDEIRLLIVNPKTGKPISLQTLNRHYRQELRVGRVKAIVGAYGNLRRAMNGKVSAPMVTANIFFLKCNGWRETPQGMQMLNPDGNDQDVAPVVFYLPYNGRDREPPKGV